MLSRSPEAPAVALALFFAAASCSPDGSTPGPTDPPGEPTPDPSVLTCDIDESQIADGGVGLGGIPALQDPGLAEPGAAGTEYLDTPDRAGTADIRDHDRVIVFQREGRWIAVPHNILWWHEVAQFTDGTGAIAATYCPLTGSSIVFDFGQLPAERFQVSGLLFNNNLMMRDPRTGSLWPQMLRAAGCGPERGTTLPVVPSIETRWEHWVDLHPETRVVTSATGFDRDYDQYPYGSYEEPSAPPLFPVDHQDPRRPMKERVLGIPLDPGGVAYPFGELATDAGRRVVHDTLDGRPIVIFWDEEAAAAAAYEPRLEGGDELSFEVRDGEVVDVDTGSTWRYDGFALDGPHEGSRLEPVADAYVAFWFAWAIFQPETEIWEASGASGARSPATG